MESGGLLFSGVYLKHLAMLGKNRSEKRKRSASGFTLIELVVVITILSILVAYVLPKFITMQADARLAKINGALASVRSAAAMAHAQLIVRGYPSNYTGTPGFAIEGVIPTYVNGYPDANNIAALAGLEPQDFGIPTAGANEQMILSDPQHPACHFIYREAATADVQPTYDISQMTLANCS